MPTLVVVFSPGTLMHQDPPFKALLTTPPTVSSCRTTYAFLSHIRFSQMFRVGPGADFWLPGKNQSSSRLANMLRHRAGECQTAARWNTMLADMAFSDCAFCPAVFFSVSLQVPEMFSISFPFHFCHLVTLFSPFFQWRAPWRLRSYFNIK